MEVPAAIADEQNLFGAEPFQRQAHGRKRERVRVQRGELSCLEAVRREVVGTGNPVKGFKYTATVRDYSFHRHFAFLAGFFNHADEDVFQREAPFPHADDVYTFRFQLLPVFLFARRCVVLGLSDPSRQSRLLFDPTIATSRTPTGACRD